MIPLSHLVPGVRATGDNLVFQVQSDSRPSIWHRVDLAAFSGLGSCSCEIFQFVIQPAIMRCKNTRRMLAYFCRHVSAAQRYLAISIAQDAIRQRLKDPDPKMSRKEWASPPC